MIVIQSSRLHLSEFQMMDAQEVLGCIARHRPIDAMGAAIVECVRDAVREQGAGPGGEHVFVRPGFWVVCHHQAWSGLGAGVVMESTQSINVIVQPITAAVE